MRSLSPGDSYVSSAISSEGEFRDLSSFTTRAGIADFKILQKLPPKRLRTSSICLIKAVLTNPLGDANSKIGFSRADCSLSAFLDNNNPSVLPFPNSIRTLVPTIAASLRCCGTK